METLSNLCRCCLTPDCEVSITEDQLVKEKFLQLTSIEIKDDDGMPQKLCFNCNAVMNSAYEFRQQCINLDADLKSQIETLLKENQAQSGQEFHCEEEPESDHAGDIQTHSETLKYSETEEPPTNKLSKELSTIQEEETMDIDMDEISNNTMKQLESIIKKEPNDSDDDYYYVLVIDDPKDKEEQKSDKNEEASVHKIVDKVKSEVKKVVSIKENPVIHNIKHELDDSLESYIVPATRVPDNVPATILENEEESQGDEDHTMINAVVNIEGPNTNSQHSFADNEESQHHSDHAIMENSTLEMVGAGQQSSNFLKNIKIITSVGGDKTIIVQEDNDHEITYLAEADIEGDENEDSQEEVIFCESDNANPFQIVKCEGNEFVIEYENDSQISTVLQQEDGTFLCDCGERFTDLKQYEEHHYAEHAQTDNTDNLCNLCGKAFETAEILVGHKMLHEVTGSFVSCPFCNQLIKRNTLNHHIKYGHNKNKPQCPVCFKTFANPNNLKRHTAIHTGIREFECDICFKRFFQKITMQTHRLTHINPFACPQCDEVFTCTADLDNHKTSNTCTKSKLIKVKEELLKTVKQSVTTNSGKVLGYACSLCKKMFSVESALEQHIYNVHIADPMDLLCPECGEVFPTKKEMQSHMLSHKMVKSKNLKRFECTQCGKGCASQAMLMMHERVHTNERPFPCQLCTLRFKTKTHLRTHQLTHTREKKYGCSVCLKFFALKGNLVVHLRTHTGERPYVCDMCDEAFIDSKYLKKHKLKRHPTETFQFTNFQ